MRVFALSICGVLAPATGTAVIATKQVQQVEQLDLATILRRLGQTYAAISVYRDQGTATVRSSVSPELNGTQRFATQFERSRQFSWVSDLGTKTDYRITFNGARVVRQWYGRRKDISTLGDAIAGATGISNSAAFWVPTLLMPEMIPGAGVLSTFRRATSAARLVDAEADGQPCFVLRARDNRLEIRVWISTRDFLIRRIEHRSAGRDVVTTTDYTPSTDISLAP